MPSRKWTLAAALVASVGMAGSPPVHAQTYPPPDKASIDEFEDLAKHYEEAQGEYVSRMKDILRREYTDRGLALDKKYKSSIDAADLESRRRHLTAKAALLEFLGKYPNDPKWTPDGMFRLADVYLDEAKWEWDDQTEKMALQGPPPEPPAGKEDNPDELPSYVGPDYTKSLGLWRAIISRFPEYRQSDGTIYLLAYYLGETHNIPESKQAYLGLVCHNLYDPLAPPQKIDPRWRPVKNPSDPYKDCEPIAAGGKRNPDLEDESWVRIGEVHFDTRGELPLAIYAYKHVAENPQSKFYDIALYKLAWSYYRNNQFMEGIQAFDELVAFSDKQEDAGEPPNDLRGEAVQYLAISFSDPWEEGAIADPQQAIDRINAFYKGRLEERHVRDVYEALGDVVELSAGSPVAQAGPPPPETLAAYRSAIEAWRFCLENYPLHPRNPVVHQKVVDALAYMGDASGAAEERTRLASAYQKGSEWYAANEMNREAMDYASRLGEGSLLEAARTVHRSAQLAKQDYQRAPSADGKRHYLKLYADAALLYQQYLGAYPTSSELYELTFRFADTLFFSEQYTAAIAPYKWVRDHKELGTKYGAEAEDSIVKSYESAIELGKSQGAIVEPPVPTAETLGSAPRPLAMPRVYKDLQATYDEYPKFVRDDTISKKSLASAMISYKFHDVADAQKRFSDILSGYCHTPEATQAKEGLLAIYQARGENDKFQATADKFISDRCGSGAADVELAQNQKLGNDYRIAVEAFKDGRFEEAGDKFYNLYKTGASSFKDRAGALFNAALAYEKAGKPKTAISLYQEMTKVGEFESSEYYVESLFRTAASYQNAFDYQAAVDTFLRVVDEAGKPGRTARPEFDLVQSRLDAMWNAAFLRDLDRVYYDRGHNDPGAATLYKRYAAAETRDRARASQAYFNAALVYEKAGSTREMIATFGDWKKLYSHDAGGGFYAVLAQYKIAKALEKTRDQKGAEQYYKETIRAFDESGEQPGSPASELAAEAQFRLAEKYYKAVFEEYKVHWLGNISSKNEKTATKAVQDTLAALAKVAKDTSASYEAIARFQASWSLAAIVRLGDVSFFAGQKLLDAPVPSEITKLDKQYPDQNVLGSYQEQLEAEVKPNVDRARDEWVRALSTAKQAGVANEWSKLAAQRLNSFIAADTYPVQRDELIDKETNP